MTDGTTAQTGGGTETAATTTTGAETKAAATTADTGATTAAATLAGGGAGDPAKVATAVALEPGKLPEGFDFRGYLANGDKAAEKDLEKYTDPRAVYKSLRDLQAKISKGELKAPAAALPANATDEQKTEWRKTNGLPASAEAMVSGLELPDGIVVGEAEKPLVAQFAKDLFDAGASQAEMNRSLASYYKLQAAQEAQRATDDQRGRIAAEVELKTEWGGDYTKNMNALGATLATMPEDLRNSLLTARTPDGRMLGDHPDFNRWAASTGRDLNPAASVVNPSDANAGKTIGDEIKTIEASMYEPNGNPNRAYWSDPKAQARYRELIDAQQKMAERGKAA